MGKQICFFAVSTDWQLIFEHVFNKNLILMDNYGNKQSFEETLNTFAQCPQKNLSHYYIAVDKSRVVQFQPSLIIDSMKSDVIEINAGHLSRLINPPEHLLDADNRYEHARFWYATSYYDDEGKTIRKIDEIDKVYSSLVRFVRKHSIKSQDGYFYILPNAYRLYKENKFRPCSGLYDIVFD